MEIDMGIVEKTREEIVNGDFEYLDEIIKRMKSMLNLVKMIDSNGLIQFRGLTDPELASLKTELPSYAKMGNPIQLIIEGEIFVPSLGGLTDG